MVMKNVTPKAPAVKKTCIKCKKSLAKTKFGKNATTEDGLRNKCKRCTNVNERGLAKAGPHSRYDNIMKRLANNEYDVITELIKTLNDIVEPTLKAKLLLELMAFMYPKRQPKAGLAINDPGPSDNDDNSQDPEIVDLKKETTEDLIKALNHVKGN